MAKGEIPDATEGGYPNPGWPPTVAEEAGRALADWIAEHYDRSSGSVWVLKDRTTVVVHWRGTVPVGLRSLAARQPVPVAFKPAPYSLDELNAAIDAVIANNPGIVSAIGSEPDRSAISVALFSTAPPDAFAQLKARAGTSIPIVFRGLIDPIPLGGR
ncbi:hypothetical protein AB0E63_11360 [Kribbella sp. NPDC026596]|uniref:hypothetical protein n=1 Tax=Kribbella sp. NPDC026596 TaxID=3155122 RepID=UPI0033F7AA96